MQSNQFVSGTGDNSGLMPTTLNTVLNSQIRYLPNSKYLFYSGLTLVPANLKKTLVLDLDETLIHCFTDS